VELLRLRVPDRECEHSAELVQACFAPPDKGGEQHFGIAVGAERPLSGKFLAKRPVIDDGTIEYERETAIRSPKRLTAIGGVVNGKAPHADRGIA